FEDQIEAGYYIPFLNESAAPIKARSTDGGYLRRRRANQQGRSHNQARQVLADEARKPDCTFYVQLSRSLLERVEPWQLVGGILEHRLDQIRGQVRIPLEH